MRCLGLKPWPRTSVRHRQGGMPLLPRHAHGPVPARMTNSLNPNGRRRFASQLPGTTLIAGGKRGPPHTIDGYGGRELWPGFRSKSQLDAYGGPPRAPKRAEQAPRGMPQLPLVGTERLDGPLNGRTSPEGCRGSRGASGDTLRPATPGESARARPAAATRRAPCTTCAAGRTA